MSPLCPGRTIEVDFIKTATIPENDGNAARPTALSDEAQNTLIWRITFYSVRTIAIIFSTTFALSITAALLPGLAAIGAPIWGYLVVLGVTGCAGYANWRSAWKGPPEKIAQFIQDLTWKKALKYLPWLLICAGVGLGAGALSAMAIVSSVVFIGGLPAWLPIIAITVGVGVTVGLTCMFFSGGIALFHKTTWHKLAKFGQKVQNLYQFDSEKTHSFWRKLAAGIVTTLLLSALITLMVGFPAFGLFALAYAEAASVMFIGGVAAAAWVVLFASFIARSPFYGFKSFKAFSDIIIKITEAIKTAILETSVIDMLYSPIDACAYVGNGFLNILPLAYDFCKRVWNYEKKANFVKHFFSKSAMLCNALAMVALTGGIVTGNPLLIGAAVAIFCNSVLGAAVSLKDEKNSEQQPETTAPALSAGVEDGEAHDHTRTSEILSQLLTTTAAPSPTNVKNTATSPSPLPPNGNLDTTDTGTMAALIRETNTRYPTSDEVARSADSANTAPLLIPN